MTSETTTGSEPGPALSDIPLFAQVAGDSTAPAVDAARATPRPAADPPFGVYRSDQLRTAPRPSAPLDWGQVVELRRRASETITEEGEHQARIGGRPLVGDDRMLMGRAIIRRVVGDHVRSLHREGSALWSPAEEEAYVEAVEDAVFGYGRLQPLLSMPEVENIEIHGCNLARHCVSAAFSDLRGLEVARRRALPELE